METASPLAYEMAIARARVHDAERRLAVARDGDDPYERAIALAHFRDADKALALLEVAATS